MGQLSALEFVVPMVVIRYSALSRLRAVAVVDRIQIQPELLTMALLAVPVAAVEWANPVLMERVRQEIRQVLLRLKGTQARTQIM